GSRSRAADWRPGPSESEGRACPAEDRAGRVLPSFVDGRRCQKHRALSIAPVRGATPRRTDNGGAPGRQGGATQPDLGSPTRQPRWGGDGVETRGPQRGSRVGVETRGGVATQRRWIADGVAPWLADNPADPASV